MGDLVLTLATQAMGTRFELVLVGPGARGDRAAARALRAAGEAAFEVIHETEARWSLFRPAGRLARLNREGHLLPVALDEDDLTLWRTALAVRDATDGAFDMDVARRTATLGKSAPAELLPEPTLGPERGTVRLEGCTLDFTAAGPAVDLGAIAKGHALDLAGRELSEAGVASALLHGGTSSVLALGAPPGRAAWQVRVAETHGAAGGGAVLDLRDLALGASRSNSQGETGHVLDPRTGVPLGRSGQPHRGALVTAPSAALADAWSTALCVDPTLAPAAEAMGLCVHAVAHTSPGPGPNDLGESGPSSASSGQRDAAAGGPSR